MAMASREVRMEGVEVYGDSFEPFPIAIDAVAIAISSDVYEGGIKNLSRRQLLSMHNGDVDSWNELGGQTCLLRP
ncbi:MAG: hypothetical protein A4E50_00253 [Methanosaeta sp. PtaB.Bin087]|nr:MAG: hypothetical protein A4E50_00253 [Methanosaeta sp. PtaB.Bin087]